MSVSPGYEGGRSQGYALAQKGFELAFSPTPEVRHWKCEAHVSPSRRWAVVTTLMALLVDHRFEGQNRFRIRPTDH